MRGRARSGSVHAIGEARSRPATTATVDCHGNAAVLTASGQRVTISGEPRRVGSWRESCPQPERMTFSQQMLTGLGAGIAVGLFFGEGAAILNPLATAFVGLLQMTVLPYVTVSIVSSLGRLDYATAKALAARVGTVMLVVWAVVLIVIFLMPLAFPVVESASFFSTTLLDERPPFDFVALYVPANPFNSLANNIVPAVVLFSVCVGVALIGLERRAVLLDVLEVVGDALARATRFIMRLTPIGLFAIAGRRHRHAAHRGAGAVADLSSSVTRRSRCSSASGCCRVSSRCSLPCR